MTERSIIGYCATKYGASGMFESIGVGDFLPRGSCRHRKPCECNIPVLGGLYKYVNYGQDCCLVTWWSRVSDTFPPNMLTLLERIRHEA